MKRWWFSVMFTFVVAVVIHGGDVSVSSQSVRSQQHNLAPGTSQTYTFKAGPGDLVIGPFHVFRGALTFELYDPRQTKIKAQWLSADASAADGDVKVGFVAPIGGTYRVVLTAQEDPVAFTWTTTKSSPAERMAGRHLEPIISYPSERIKQLEKEVASRVPGALERFWTEVALKGGPIVESLPKRAGTNANSSVADEDVLVTFVWRQIYDTYSVQVQRAPYGPVSYRLMTNLPGTDVWYKTMKLHHDSRLMYQIAPNYRGYDEDGDVPREPDPLNPRLFPQTDDRWSGKQQIDFDPAAAWGSVLSLPGAPDESWARTVPPRRGTVVDRVFDSPSLKARIGLHLYTPFGYDASSGPYPAIVLFDGFAYAKGMIAAPTTIDNLVAADRIRAPVVIFVDSVTDVVKERGANLNNQGFLDAITSELMPWVRSTYAISGDPKDNIIGGYSGGAVAAARIALSHADVFGNVLLQSGGAGAGERYIATPKVPLRFYFDLGLYELTPGDLPFDDLILAEGMTAANRRFRDILRAKGYDVIYHETGGDHSTLHWRATLGQALITLLPHART
jgi:enterochelin esterase family protein